MSLKAAPSSTLTRTLSGLAAAGAVLLTPACGKDAPPPAPPAPEVAATPEVPDVPAAPASRLGEVEAWDATPIDAGNVGDVTSLASALQAEGTPEATAAAARLRLTAVAALTAQTVDGFDAEAQLRQVLTLTEQGGEALAPLRTLARILLPVTDAKEAEAVKAAEIKALADADPFARDVLRTVARRGLALLAEGTPDAKMLDALARRFGHLVCDTCHQVAAGLDAAPALACTDDGAGPACAPINELVKADAVFAEPVNRLVIGLFETLRGYAGAQSSHKGLATAAGIGLPPRSAHVPALAPMALLPHVALGEGALGVITELPDLVVTIDGEGLGLGQRPFIADGGVSPAIAAGLLASHSRLSPEALVAADVADVVKARLRNVLPEGPPPEARAAAVAVKATTPSGEVATALDALGHLGLGGVRFLVNTPGAAVPLHVELPLLVRTLPEAAAKALSTGAERELLVAVGPDAIDIWLPESPVDAAEGVAAVTPIGADRADVVRSDLARGWRGETLARLRVAVPARPAPATDGENGAEAVAAPAPKDLALEPAVIKAVVDAVAKVRPLVGASSVVQVAGHGETPAAAVLDVAAALQGAPGKAPAGVDAALWKGKECAAAGCPGQVVVAFSGRGIPSDRGLSDAPRGKKAPAQPAAPKEAPASPEFCNKNDIQAQMNKAKGRFRFCYEKELQLLKDLKGRVNARFTIGLDGKVSSVGLSGDLNNKNVESCVSRELKKLSFAKPNGGACLVNWPFVFGSGG